MRDILLIIVALLPLNIGVLTGSVPRVVADNTTVGHITGMAVDAEGKGVSGVSVTVQASGDGSKPLASGTTDDKGSFTLDVPAPASDLVVDLKQDLKPFPTSATKVDLAVEPAKTTDIGKIEMKIQLK